jgi:hypothetical protein
MVIGGYFINGYWWFLLLAFGGYSINDNCFLFLLVDIGGY